MARVELKPEEALVLLEFLLRFRDREVLTIEHHSEECVLWDLCALIESQVPELLDPDYRDRLQLAREAVASEDWE